MVIISMMGSWSKHPVSDLVPSNVSKNAILNVTSEQSLLREWDSILSGVNSPSKIPSEKEGPLVSKLDLLVQIVLEKFLWLTCSTHLLFIK